MHRGVDVRPRLVDRAVDEAFQIGRPGVADRDGYVSAYEIGTRMSGTPMWASNAPSRKRTSEWTIDDGCTTTSIASYGSPKSQCASISSSPLFASVAESIVIFGPMDQVG